MNVTDELERLHGLKEKGVLSEEEFNAKKAQILKADTQEKKGPRSIIKILFATIGIVVGGIGLLSAVSSLGGGADFPTCDSDAATNALKNAFDQAQFAKAYNLSAIDVAGAKELSYDKSTGVRSCKAGIVMNNTSTANVEYQMEPRDGGKFMLTFKVVTDGTMANPAVLPHKGDVQDNPAQSSRPPEPASTAITGTYEKHDQDGDGELKAERLAGSRLRFDVFSSSPQGSGRFVSSGQVTGEAIISAGVAHYSDRSKDCALNIKFSDAGAEVTQNGMCEMGFNVSAAGRYRKVSGEAPSFTN